MKLEPLIVKRAFAAGERLSEEGVVEHTVRVVKLGMVMRLRKGEDGRERPLGIAERGIAFGLFGVFGQPNQSTAFTLTPGRVCEFPVEALRTLTSVDPQMSRAVLSYATSAWGRVAAWSEGMRVRGTINQLAYALVLLRDAVGQDPVKLPTHTAMGWLLGTTRETIVRGLAVLEQEGLVTRNDRRTVDVRREAILAWLGAAPEVELIGTGQSGEVN